MDPSSAASHTAQEALRKLPSVDHLLNQPAIASLLDDYPRGEVVHVIRALLDERRAALRAGQPADVAVPTLALEFRQRLYDRSRPNLRKVINATGIVLHTGLGRAPLADEALTALADVAAGYCNLELNLASGKRGNRHDHVRDLLRELTGAADALVVNNNAAATYLALSTLAGGREAIVSRGQLVEIGGSYRLPDILAAANCRMLEVGTTNRTRIGDYERAITLDTAVLLRVHPSNYRIIGFTESASLTELVTLAHQRNLLVVDDLGSGLLTRDLPWPADSAAANAAVTPPAEASAPGNPAARTAPVTPATAEWQGPGAQTDLPFGSSDASSARASGAGTASAFSAAAPIFSPSTGAVHPRHWDEPTVADSLAAGADLTLFSGDKLLGGPQAGILLGRADLIAACRKNPLARALRPGKLTLAALEATLRLYRDPAAAMQRIPLWRMLSRTPAELERAARALAEALAEAWPGARVTIELDASEAGGGSLAAFPFPTYVAVLHPPANVHVDAAPPPREAGTLPPGVVNGGNRAEQKPAAAELADALRRRDLPIICRVRDDALVFDPRTLEPEDFDQIAGALLEVVRE